MKISLVFEDWQRFDGKQLVSVYQENYELSLGDFHSGTTFPAEIGLDAGNEAELREALEKGFVPVFRVVADESAD